MDLHSLTAAIPDGFGSDYHPQAVKCVSGPSHSGSLSGPILTCFVTTCIRPLLVHTLNSRLWNTKRFGNLNTVWLNTIAPFLPLRHIYPCWQCYTVPIKTVKVHWPSHFTCCAQLSMWPNCCTRSTCETIQLWLQVGWLTFCLGCLFMSSVMIKIEWGILFLYWMYLIGAPNYRTQSQVYWHNIKD